MHPTAAPKRDLVLAAGKAGRARKVRAGPEAGRAGRGGPAADNVAPAGRAARAVAHRPSDSPSTPSRSTPTPTANSTARSSRRSPRRSTSDGAAGLAAAVLVVLVVNGPSGRHGPSDADSRRGMAAAGGRRMLASMSHTVAESLPARPAEAHALAVARNLPGSRIVCTTTGRAQAAHALAVERPDASVAAWFLDLHPCEAARASWNPPPPNLRATCAADMPAGSYDLAVVPLAKDGETELTREILQQAFVNLAIGGRLVAAIDNPHDKWLREQLAETGETVRVRPEAGGNAASKKARPQTIAYIVEKTREPAKVRDFSCEVVFRDRDRLLTARTRPGVFAHRRIDPAARHLLNAVDVAAETRVLDIGCGSGCVALGIAAREPSVRVHAFDSAARAVECTRWGADHNGLANLTVALEAEGHVPEPGTWDLALANPPYYSDFRLAELFVESARLALAPGGTLLVVTKQPTWYLEHLPQMWTNVAREEVKGYHLIEAIRPG